MEAAEIFMNSSPEATTSNNKTNESKTESPTVVWSNQYENTRDNDVDEFYEINRSIYDYLVAQNVLENKKPNYNHFTYFNHTKKYLNFYRGYYSYAEKETGMYYFPTITESKFFFYLCHEEEKYIMFRSK